MKIITLCVFLMLAALSNAAPTTSSFSCTVNGQVYNNVETFLHENGCTQYQCQFGKVVPIIEACGKDVDGQCHPLSSEFEYNEESYRCNKVEEDGKAEYRNQQTSPVYRKCTAEGNTFEHLQRFKLSSGCAEYQCQNGNVTVIEPACGTDVDGKCHYLGEWFLFNNKVYECRIGAENGVAVYQNVIRDPQPPYKRSCNFGTTTKYAHLEKFNTSDGCKTRQCQDGATPFIKNACPFSKDGKCYPQASQWIFQGSFYQCNVETGSNGLPVFTIQKTTKYKTRCVIGETWYDELALISDPTGCRTLQCQSQSVPYVAISCHWSEDDQCHRLNSIWTTNGVTRKCILTDDGLYQVVRLDENGNVIINVPEEEVDPVIIDEGCPAYADIIYVVDSSGSITNRNYQRALQFLSDIARYFKIGPQDVRFGAVIFSGIAQKLFDLNSYDTHEQIEEALLAAPFLWNITNTHKAFNLIVEQGMFKEAAGGRPDADDIVIIMTDGNSTDTSITLAAASRVKALGAKILSVGIGRVSDVELIGMASGPQNVFRTTSYEVINTLLSDLSRRACDATDEEPPEPPSESNVTLCKDAVADIIFVIDSSTTVGSGANFTVTLKFLADVTKAFTIGPEDVQFGAVLYSSEAKTLFDLNAYSSRDEIVEALNAATYLTGDTNTYAALNSVRTDGLFAAGKGGRANAAKVVIVITGGPSENQGLTVGAAKALRGNGVHIISVGIGQASDDELKDLAGSARNLFSAASYNLLNYVQEQLAQRTCEILDEDPIPPGPPRCSDFESLPCEHVCTDTDDGFVCSCRPGYEVSSRDSSQCDDIDECSNTDKPVCEQICINNEGSYQCACRDGFVADVEDSSKCKDIDECDAAESPCQQICTNSPGSFGCSCRDGYEVNAIDSTRCQDVNECSGDSQPCEQICTNTEGSYDCSCRDGYAVSSSDPTKCEDADECSGNNPCSQVCSNTAGGYECSCRDGYQVNAADSTQCDDVDECSGDSNPCEQICTNTEGSYECSCRDGYTVSDADSSKCTDVDECNADVSPCEQFCTNTDGSYECSCEDGYEVNADDSTQCDDVDECSNGNNNCEQTCTNTEGSYECSCRDGYEVSADDATQCDDVDECSAESSPCEQKCANTDGSYECSCRDGYSVSADDASQCEDVDECSNGNSNCEQTCTNTDGSYECSCRDGYEISADDATQCDDVDECSAESSPCEQTCTNTDGSYECSCRDGYSVSADDASQCDDIDECSADVSPCEQICTNTDGSYECSCEDGYEVSADDSTQCDDVDECSAESSPCEQTCTNTDGSYECSCRDGYSVSADDAAQCEDVDECSADVSPCEQICTNTDGSFECSCEDGYEVSDDNPTQCDDVDECSNGDNDCQQTCTNTDGSYECSCRDGYTVNTDDANRCDDIDECSGDNPCEQTCTNSEGSFECSCADGYVVSDADQTKCEDVDECDDNPCEHNCTNLVGSFECSCAKGYSVSEEDKLQCEDIDECDDSPCEHFCTNTVGSYICTCQPGYVPSASDPNKCEDEDECADPEKNECEHICTNTLGFYECSCREGYIVSPEDSTQCDLKPCPVVVKADIYFVLDSSGSIGIDNYNKTFAFVSNVIDSFTIGPNDVLFGAMIFSQDVQKLFDLKDYTDKKAIYNALMAAPYMGQGTYTHKALLFVGYWDVFGAAQGGRSDATKIIVIVTDGKSSRSSTTIQYANNLKNKGILIMCIGVGSDVSVSELEAMATSDSDVFQAGNYDMLPYIEEKVAKRACDAPAEAARRR